MATILIVDDQACVRQAVSEELAAEGHQVTMAEDTESLQRQVRFSRPDLVILDLYLQGPDGIAALHDIKRQYPDLPVIIFTAYDSYREDPRLSQASAYVIKSSLLDELKETIEMVLAGSNHGFVTSPTSVLGCSV